jgi:PAS domain S-box-containing protein
MPPEDSPRILKSPALLLGIGLGLTLLLLGAAGVATMQLQSGVERQRVASYELEASLNRIELLGRTAFYYRGIAVASRESRWVEAHEQSVVELEEELIHGRQLATTPPSQRALARADSINQLITEHERKGIRLMIAGDVAAAQQLFESPEFRENVALYTDALLGYARSAGVAERLSNARTSISFLRDQVEALASIAFENQSGLDEVESFIGFVGHILDEQERALEAEFSSPVMPNVREQFDSFVKAVIDGEDSSRIQNELLASLDMAAQLVNERLNRLHVAERNRSLLVSSLYAMIAGLLILLWVVIARMLRRHVRERDLIVNRLRASDKRNLALLAAVPDVIFVHDGDGRFIDFHAPTQDALLLPASEFMGKRLGDVLPEPVASKMSAVVAHVAATKRPAKARYELEINGELRHFEARLAAEDGERVLSIVRDISDLLQAEERIREGEARFRSLVENALVGTYLIRNEHFVYVNPRFAAMFGWAQDEIVGLPVAELVNPPHILMNGANGGCHTSVNKMLRCRRRNGEPFMAEVFGSLAELDAQPVVLGTILDVTERERSRAQVAALKSFYENTLNRLPIEVAVLDRGLRYLFLNPTAVADEERRTELIGKSIEAMGELQGFDPERIHVRREWLEGVIRDRQTGELEEAIKGDGGEFQHLLRVAAPVIAEDGDVHHLVTYTLDVTQRKEYEHTLLDARDKAEQMARLKSAFLANMSHEIRTPLTGILGFASLLEEEVDEAQRGFATLIVRSGKRLLDTLNAVLDLSRLEAGEMKIDLHPTDVSIETLEIASFLRPLAVEKGIELNVESDEDSLCYIDPSAYHIILNNLIGNAIKFTDEGQVMVSVERDDKHGVLRVADTGVGIDAAFLPQLFEEFKQESIGLTRSHEGAGLGLAITRRLVHLMGGTIDVDSAKGRGTTFTVRLPLAIDNQLDLPLVESVSFDKAIGK